MTNASANSRPLSLCSVNLVSLFISLAFVLLSFKAVWVLIVPKALVNLAVIVPLAAFCGVAFYSELLKGCMSRVNLYLSLFVALFLALALKSVLSGVAPQLVFTSASQLLFPYLTMFALYNCRYENLLVSRKVMLWSLSVLVACSLVEALLPSGLKLEVIRAVLAQKMGTAMDPNAYYAREFNIPMMRLGSLTFEPITFSFLCSLLVLFLMDKSRNLVLNGFVILMNLLSLGKAAILCSLMALAAKRLRRLFFVLIPIGIAFLVVMVKAQPQNYYDLFTSMGNHVLGLYFGALYGLDNFLFGAGIGTAGYLTYLKAREMGILFELFDPLFPAGVSNGNESTVGILLFQIGYLGAALYLTPFVFIVYRFYKERQFLYSGYAFAFFLAMFLSESVLNYSIMFTFLYLMILKNCELRIGATGLTVSAAATPSAPQLPVQRKEGCLNA